MMEEQNDIITFVLRGKRIPLSITWLRMHSVGMIKDMVDNQAFVSNHEIILPFRKELFDNLIDYFCAGKLYKPTYSDDNMVDDKHWKFFCDYFGVCSDGCSKKFSNIIEQTIEIITYLFPIKYKRISCCVYELSYNSNIKKYRFLEAEFDITKIIKTSRRYDYDGANFNEITLYSLNIELYNIETEAKYLSFDKKRGYCLLNDSCSNTMSKEYFCQFLTELPVEHRNEELERRMYKAIENGQ
jgi:hypothetical protein